MIKKLLFLVLFLFAVIPPILARAAISHPEIVQQQSDSADLNVFQYVNNVVPGIASSLGDTIVPSRLANGSTNHYGAVPVLNNGIAFLTSQPPVMSRDYIADVLQNTGIVQPAYAQGLGFASLTPILQIWKMFRNIAYFLFIIVFVVIGFMIMFRSQVDHQTIVSIQMALPKLVVTLILITFSYAIAGFVVDLLYLSIFLVIALFAQFGIISNAQTMTNALLGRSIFRIAFDFLIWPRDTSGSAANAVSAILQGFIRVPNFFNGLIDWLIDSIAYLVIAVAILIATFRTFFALLMAYIGIILATIFAPIQLMLNAIPGQNTFSTWLKGLVANALIFPAISIIIILGIFLAAGDTSDAGIVRSTVPGTQNAGFGLNEGTGFVPPFITSRDQNDTATTFGVEQIRALIGLGMIMLLPEIAKIVKKAVGVEESGLFEGIGAGLKGGAGTVMKPIQTVGSGARTVGTNYVGYKITDYISNMPRGEGTKSGKIQDAVRGTWNFMTRREH